MNWQCPDCNSSNHESLLICACGYDKDGPIEVNIISHVKEENDMKKDESSIRAISLLILVVCTALIIYPNSIERRLVREPNISILDVLRLKWDHRPTPAIVDWSIDHAIDEITVDGQWSNPIAAEDIYDFLKTLQHNMVIDSLAKHVLGTTEVRKRTLILALKLGIDGSEARLATILEGQNDKRMAEDYLNCGSDELYRAALRWAEVRGFSIGQGSGSHRAAWGKF